MLKEENKILSLTDFECIQKGIARSKCNYKFAVKDNEFGHCRKHYLMEDNFH